MGYQSSLKLSLIPTTLLLLLSLVSIVLTTHYWILSDWIMGRWMRVIYVGADGKTSPDDTIVDYTGSDTDMTIVSGCLCLGAAVMAFVAWSKLRRQDMDSDFNAPSRRFYTLAVWVMSAAGAVTALASIVLHYTEQGDDEWGCSSSREKMTSGTNTNMMCTREMGACNFIKTQLKKAKSDKLWSAELACNEAVAVKWLQIVLIINALAVAAMFALQAWQRKKTRYQRLSLSKEQIVNPI